jgi:hypothetical protein
LVDSHPAAVETLVDSHLAEVETTVDLEVYPEATVAQSVQVM